MGQRETIFWNRRSRAYKDEGIKDYIRAHLTRCGYEMTDIVVMTRPKHWSHSNVMLAGRGKKLTVVVFAHAAQALPPEELLAAVMHEMGHLKGHHAPLRIAFLGSLGFMAAFLVGNASLDPAFFIGFGFAPFLLELTPGVHSGFTVALGILTFPIFFYPFQPLSNFIARTMQYSADRFAAGVTGPDPVCNMILRLHKDKSQTLFPSRLYTLFHYERPRVGMRIAKLKTFKKTWDAQGATPVAPRWISPIRETINVNALKTTEKTVAPQSDKREEITDGQEAATPAR